MRFERTAKLFESEAMKKDSLLILLEEPFSPGPKRGAGDVRRRDGNETV
jgi:hypothetical protein